MEDLFCIAVYSIFCRAVYQSLDSNKDDVEDLCFVRQCTCLCFCRIVYKSIDCDKEAVEGLCTVGQCALCFVRQFFLCIL